MSDRDKIIGELQVKLSNIEGAGFAHDIKTMK